MCHVLIIEDEPIVALHLQGVLEAGGGSSFGIADTEEGALEAARAKRPEFISSDVNLSQGTGPSAVAAIHREHGTIPVIWVTASPEQCDGCAPEHILTKPWNDAEVVRLFQELAPI